MSAHKTLNRQLTDAQSPDAELLSPVTIDAYEMACMNFARLEFHRLYALLYPMCSKHSEGPMCDIARHLEQVIMFSGNFVWKHRHVGASHSVIGEARGPEVSN